MGIPSNKTYHPSLDKHTHIQSQNKIIKTSKKVSKIQANESKISKLDVSGKTNSLDRF
ncbi:MAG: hypothetical protein H0U49_12160, partial [Parachlamydiaceae bacterium]|nr:hypothetical protein [Parachlamydiaceae bacterium]